MNRIQSVNYYLSSISKYFLSVNFVMWLDPRLIQRVQFTEHARTPAMLPVQLESGNSVIRLPSSARLQDYNITQRFIPKFPEVILLHFDQHIGKLYLDIGAQNPISHVENQIIPKIIKPPKVANNFLIFVVELPPFLTIQKSIQIAL